MRATNSRRRDPARDALRAIARDIAAYRRKTHRDEYTDVGEAWELFDLIEKLARTAARRGRAQ